MEVVVANTLAQVQQIIANAGYRLCSLDPDKLFIHGTNREIPRSGIVIWRAANPREKIRNCNYSVTFDNKSMICYGQPIKVDAKTGSITWRPIFIENTLVLDLSNHQQRIQHYLLWHNQSHKSGPCFHGLAHYRGGLPTIVVDDPNAHAEAAMKKRESIKHIERIVDDMPEDSKLLFAATLGIDVRKNRSKAFIFNMLYEQIEKDPNEVMKRYTDPDRKVWEIFNLAVQYDVVTLSNIGYVFNQTALGADKKTAVIYLRGENGAALLSVISSLVDSARGVTVAGVQATPPPAAGAGEKKSEFF